MIEPLDNGKEYLIDRLISDVGYNYYDDPFFTPSIDELIGSTQFSIRAAVL